MSEMNSVAAVWHRRTICRTKARLTRTISGWGSTTLIFVFSLTNPIFAAGSPDLKPVGPALSAASNFSQGWSDDSFRRALALGVRDFRDGMTWGRAEPTPGQYVFSDPRTNYPERIAQTDTVLGVVLNWGSPLYDAGDTPNSSEAIAAFGDFAAVLVARYGVIDNLEIGNEFNGTNFVRGPIAHMTPPERAAAYVPLLAAASQRARSVRPEIRIIGGATHSLPAGYLWAMLNAGARPYLDALAIHPYTTPAEQLVSQVAVLRRHPLAADLPLEVTEFGHPDPDRAADHFLRNYCQMALVGVTRAVWYPLNARGDGMVPLFRPDGRITAAGRAFRFIAQNMEGRPVVDAGSDPFTYGCRFGDDILVMWGAPRNVVVADDIAVFDAEGLPLKAPHTIEPERARIFLRKGGNVAEGISLADHEILADSFHEFAYPTENSAYDSKSQSRFRRFARRGTREIPLLTQPGQERSGVPWFPYLGNDAIFPARLTAETLVLADRGGDLVEIVHDYIATRDGEVRLNAVFEVAERSRDGVVVRVSLDGALLDERVGDGKITIDRTISMPLGSTLEISVGPYASADGDVVDYRIGLSQP